MFDLKQYVNDTLKNNGDVARDFFSGDYDETFHEKWNKSPPTYFSSQGITYKLVQDVGGEDMGSTYYSVYQFTKDDQEVFVKFDGWYASYDGASYEEYLFVTPQQVVVTKYV